MNSNVVVAASKPFRLIVGPNQREFAIHTAIFAKQSRCLERLVNGLMKEATEGKATWESVDEDTFVRFWQFAYTGDYEVWDEPSGQIAAGSVAQVEEPPSEPEPEPEPEPRSLFGNSFHTVQRNVSPPIKKETLSTRFVALGETSHKPNLGHLAGSDGKHLLNHAKVFVFADCYEITLLIELSYNKLHQTLSKLVLRSEASKAAVVALAQYCLETDVPDRLKELVVLFVACKFERLLENERFGELLDAHGNFGRNILELSQSRLE
ncbi:hypothetical protein EsHS_00003074 [Epichloe bromicola]